MKGVLLERSQAYRQREPNRVKKTVVFVSCRRHSRESGNPYLDIEATAVSSRFRDENRHK